MSNLATVTPIKPHLEVVEHRAEPRRWPHPDCKYTAGSCHAFWAYSTATDCYGCVAQDIRLWENDWIEMNSSLNSLVWRANQMPYRQNEFIRMGVLTQVGRQGWYE